MKDEIKEGASITISKSSDLSIAQLDGLVGRKAVIEEVIDGKSIRRQNRGAWVKLIGETYQGEKSWFIPAVSIDIPKTERADEAKDLEFVLDYEEGSGVAHASMVEV